jgi:hypothetical protein
LVAHEPKRSRAVVLSSLASGVSTRRARSAYNRPAGRPNDLPG